MRANWTRHGHWIGTPFVGPVDAAAYADRPKTVANCGGPQGVGGKGCLSCMLDGACTLEYGARYGTLPAPRVGDRVVYTSFGTPGGEYPKAPRAATVTEVDEVNRWWVGLAVLNPTGLFFRSLADGGAHHDFDFAGGSWSWPPERPE